MRTSSLLWLIGSLPYWAAGSSVCDGEELEDFMSCGDYTDEMMAATMGNAPSNATDNTGFFCCLYSYAVMQLMEEGKYKDEYIISNPSVLCDIDVYKEVNEVYFEAEFNNTTPGISGFPSITFAEYDEVCNATSWMENRYSCTGSNEYGADFAMSDWCSGNDTELHDAMLVMVGATGCGHILYKDSPYDDLKENITVFDTDTGEIVMDNSLYCNANERYTDKVIAMMAEDEDYEELRNCTDYSAEIQLYLENDPGRSAASSWTCSECFLTYYQVYMEYARGEWTNDCNSMDFFIGDLYGSSVCDSTSAEDWYDLMAEEGGYVNTTLFETCEDQVMTILECSFDERITYCSSSSDSDDTTTMTPTTNDDTNSEDSTLNSNARASLVLGSGAALAVAATLLIWL